MSSAFITFNQHVAYIKWPVKRFQNKWQWQLRYGFGFMLGCLLASTLLAMITVCIRINLQQNKMLLSNLYKCARWNPVSPVIQLKDMRGDRPVCSTVSLLSQCHLTAHTDAGIIDVSATTLHRPHMHVLRSYLVWRKTFNISTRHSGLSFGELLKCFQTVLGELGNKHLPSPYPELHADQRFERAMSLISFTPQRLKLVFPQEELQREIISFSHILILNLLLLDRQMHVAVGYFF